jgi:hypothetical protein
VDVLEEEVGREASRGVVELQFPSEFASLRTGMPG